MNSETKGAHMFRRRLPQGKKLQRICDDIGISLTPLERESTGDKIISDWALQQRYLSYLRERRESTLWLIAIIAAAASVLSAAVASRAYHVATLSALASEESANAATAGVRAWIDVADWRVPPPGQVNDGIGKLIENVGKTVALNPAIMEESFFLSDKNSSIPPLTNCDDFPLSQRKSIGSVTEPDSQKHEIPPQKLDHPFTSDQIVSLSRHVGAAILHGCITYKLVGTSKKVGVTEFCSVFYLNADSKQTQTCGIGVRME
jgi:hypothetical protein